MNKEKVLYKKIEQFIRKYYKSKIIKGVLLFFSSSLLLLIVFSLAEHVSKMESLGRAFLFWFYVVFNSFVFIKYIFLPLLRLFKIKGQMSRNFAAKIIGERSDKIKDKLINYIELEEIDQKGNELLKASISQKIKELENFSFHEAVNFGENKKFIKYIILPISIIIIIFFIGGVSLLKDGGKRIALYSHEKNYFSPFKFIILNESLSCAKHEDITVIVKLEGESVPEKCFFETSDGYFFEMKKKSNLIYEHEIKNIQETTYFKIHGNGYHSKKNKIEVFNNPELIGFSVEVTPPKHTKEETELIKNTGNIVVLKGSTLRWSFETKNTNFVLIDFGDDLNKVKVSKSFLKQITKNETYFLSLKNSKNQTSKIKYKIEVIDDYFPKIAVQDTFIQQQQTIYFTGFISDDYGFNGLDFFYKNKNDSVFKKQNLKISYQKTYQNFQFSFEIETLKDSVINFYFEVTDNDALVGGKKTKTELKTMKLFKKDDITKKIKESNMLIKNQLDISKSSSSEISENINKMKNNLLNNELSLWEKKQQIEKVKEKYKGLEKNLEEVKNQLKEKNINLMSEQEKEKMIALQKMLDKLIDEEIKKMLEDIEKMIKENDDKKIIEKIKKIEKTKEEIDNEIERYKELFKQLEFEERFQNTIEKIKSLSNEQEDVQKMNEEKEDFSVLEKKQEKIKKEFEEIKKDLEELEQLNDSLSKPNKMENTSEEEEEILKDIEKSIESLNKKMRQESQKQQKSTKEKIDKLSNKLQSSQSAMKMQSTYEDIDNLRQLLDNLIVLSLNQENIINKTNIIEKNNPEFVKNMIQQKNILDNSLMIQDSLFALSKRVIQIKSIVNKEIEEMNINLNKSIASLEERKTNVAQEKQQYVMKSANNLALLLSDVLLQMEKSLSKMTDGEKMCNNPNSKGKGSLSNIKGLQDGIKKRLEEMMKKGKNKKGKDGRKNNQEMIELSSEQEFLRLKLSEITKELSGEKEIKKMLKEIEEMMKQNEEDIINQKFDNIFMMRQNKIKTRLLKADKALKEQDFEEKRTSKEWEEKQKYDIQENILKQKIKQEIIEEKIYKTTPYYKDFYKEKIINYFKEYEK